MSGMISIIIPCRNEEKYIAQCLDSIIANGYPKDQLEVLVVDGMSDDGTRTIIETYAIKYGYITMLDNEKKITPSALNIGLRNAKGTTIMRMDVHVIYPENYISGLLRWLAKTGADNVGGICLTCPAKRTLMAEAIAMGMSHWFGVGNSYFRIGTSEPRWVDTVPFGCYRREVFEQIGMFDEELARNQDDEFNLRLINNGGRILLVPDIVLYYYARDSLQKLWRMYYQYGYFKPLVIRKIGGILTIRQVVPAMFVLSMLISGILAPWLPLAGKVLAAVVVPYAIVNLGCSTVTALQRGAKYGFVLPVVFLVLHLGYGLGFLRGIVDFLVHNRTQPLNVTIQKSNFQ
jgi:glycosyltransferase involved in cell wall biosynthesis